MKSREKEKLKLERSKKRPAYLKRSRVEREFIEVITDFIEFQDAPIEHQEEVKKRTNEKKNGRHVIPVSTVRTMLRKMDKFGHIKWLEDIFKERMQAELGDFTPGKPGPTPPSPGDMKTYSILTDTKGRSFARIPTCTLGLDDGEKILVEFRSSRIIITPQKEIES